MNTRPSDEVASERRLVGVQAAQEMLGGIGRTTLYRLRRDGELDSVSIGRRSLITVDSIDAYVARLRTEQERG
jgi:excisionase family DNA binding protein